MLLRSCIAAACRKSLSTAAQGCNRLARRSAAVSTTQHSTALLLSSRKSARTTVAAAAAAAATAAFAANTLAAQCDGLACKMLGDEVQKLSLATEMDKDGDGKLSKQEVKEMFERLDANKDGVVTLGEWRQYLRESGMSEAKQVALERVFRDLDKDSSGTISRDEFEAGFQKEYFARYARGAVVAFLTKGRFIAYTSDIGESARPVMPSWFVNACYGLTFVYVAVAVGSHTEEAYSAGASQIMVARTFAHSATFELLASVAMPSLIIHQAVHFAQHQAHRLPAGSAARWAPTVVGLCCIPFLPYLDPPVETAIEAAFDFAWPDDGTLPKHGSDH